jgi:hypothetical protein
MLSGHYSPSSMNVPSFSSQYGKSAELAIEMPDCRPDQSEESYINNKLRVFSYEHRARDRKNYFALTYTTEDGRIIKTSIEKWWCIRKT